MDKYLINARFKHLRKELGYTQEEFSKILGIKRCSLGAYEENRAKIQLKFFPIIIEMGFIKKEELYDFIFKEDFEFAY